MKDQEGRRGVSEGGGGGGGGEIGVAGVSAVRRHSRASGHPPNDWRLSSPRGSNLIREGFWPMTRSPLSSRVFGFVCTRMCVCVYVACEHAHALSRARRQRRAGVHVQRVHARRYARRYENMNVCARAVRLRACPASVFSGA